MIAIRGGTIFFSVRPTWTLPRRTSRRNTDFKFRVALAKAAPGKGLRNKGPSGFSGEAANTSAASKTLRGVSRNGFFVYYHSWTGEC